MSTPGEMLSAIGRRLGSGRSADEPHVFRGRSVEELIPRIQRELGPDAIVLRRREGLTGGVLGFFQQQWVEIEAVAGEPRLDVYDESEDATPPIPPPAAPEPAPAPALAEGPPTPPAPAPLGYGAPAPYVQPAPPAQPAPHAQPAAYTQPAAHAAPPAPPLSDPARLWAQSPAEQAGGSAYVTAHL